MSDLWQTIEQAAVSLQLSVRTVNRHITSGKLSSRLTSGRREVLLPKDGKLDSAIAVSPDDGPPSDNETLRYAVRDALSRLNGLADEPPVAPIDFTSTADDDALAGAFVWEQLRASRVETAEGERERLSPKPVVPFDTSSAISRHASQVDPVIAQDDRDDAATEPVVESDIVSSSETQPEEEGERQTLQPPDVVYVSQQSSATPTLDSGFNASTFLALVDNAADKADLAVAAYQTLARAADARVQASRRSARIAWSAVALMGVAVAVAVGWTVHRLTESSMAAGSLQQRMSASAGTLDEVTRERESLRTEVVTVREKAARDEGKLEAAAQIQARLEAEIKEAKGGGDARSAGQSAATKPSFFDRLSALLPER